MKLVSIAIFGAGYVLGTKAGKERYEQILEAAQNASQRLETYGNGGSLAKDRGSDASISTNGGSERQ